MSNTSQLVYWTLFLTAFFSMARKSNLVPTPTINTPDHFILRSDITLHPEYAILNFRSSKTNQFSSRIHSIPLFKTDNIHICPVTHLHKMFNRVPASSDSPAFILPNHKPITYNAFNSYLKYLIKLIALDPNNFSTHSFRRGGATLAFQSQVEPELIKFHGDWKSDAYLVYLEYNFSQKLSVSKRMAANINII
jgi:hypothetical protein